jgi:Uma2 family endonuclease
MSGASNTHVTINGNLLVMVKTHLRGGLCLVLQSDMKLRAEADNAVYYPHLLVTRDEHNSRAAAELVKAHPLLPLELLPPSTSGYDHGVEFASHRKLPSVREYVLIDGERRLIEVFRNDGSGHWVLYPFADDDEVEFASVDLRIPIAAIDEDTDLAA